MAGANTAKLLYKPIGNIYVHNRLLNQLFMMAGYWKLRQITLGYDFTRFIPAKWPIKGLKLDFVANNVLIIKKWVDNIDPETVGYGV